MPRTKRKSADQIRKLNKLRKREVRLRRQLLMDYIQQNMQSLDHTSIISDQGWQMFGVPVKEEKESRDETPEQILECDVVVKEEEVDCDEILSKEKLNEDVLEREKNLGSCSDMKEANLDSDRFREGLIVECDVIMREGDGLGLYVKESGENSDLHVIEETNDSCADTKVYKIVNERTMRRGITSDTEKSDPLSTFVQDGLL
ncbi:uncharacterized protein LOC121875359 isoform X2 [Homarus americanus]|uniref:uncharacterized protein LOC121875359 isoform X2 n=1 Tax=Homarus americanus TaxID=6706 RepID=UPI001C43BB8A|nr:uncharacterized protein LOC121875359 isoform X2 [Homarus americanus]XP_042235833.1 uncharacterized protein LOC121875359 isoform X2 [Homarus americanus]